MNLLINKPRLDTALIPLFVFDQQGCDAWCAEQDDFTRTWVARSLQQQPGLCVLPNPENGEPQSAILVAADVADMWAAGDIIGKLPKGDYQLQNTANERDIALGFVLGGYQFSGYKQIQQPQARLLIGNSALYDDLVALVESTQLVRDLVNTPAADMMPQHLSEVMSDLAQRFGGEFSQWIGDELLEQNYPTIHLVGRASENKPRLLDLRWGKKDAPKITLVGKGVCFDSGGLDLKPAAGMRLMKKDMGGAAHVIGLANLIMAMNLNIQLRVLVPAVENAVSRNAFRPGDVVKTRKGLTVEIDNTDAEGRLVLCDALDEAQQDDPDMIIDFATLTGAMRIALGTELPGFFSNDDAVAEALTQAGEQSQDPVWRMPLFAQYKNLMKSDVADLTNCAPGPFGGAITAALYLQEFIDAKTPWVHFDVMAWNVRALPGRPVGGEAFGIRAVYAMLAEKYGR
ncbi:leucyl aminopeptidase family protein [Pseudoalteromonas sp. T1lg48]|uniref:leucyl aminopeptidase family protein n=1 Tax=Pseudoalteromonas sp. T1lg48 TaxID=2077100 RepID=UPI000CF6ED7B|nr:leucyl aminopeptidase family protein [Pseudoalteromonas sp. T1lg48]